MTWDMIGHDWAVKLLQGHIINQRTRHAYVINGPPGVGKRTMALRFAQAILCQQPPSPGEYCDRCRACRTVPNMVHPDVHIVEAEQNERTIKVDQIRDLQRAISLSPYEGSQRVGLLHDFHMATDQAANALLKTLEEPPPQVMLVLTADSVETLLPTIVSRCEQINLRPVPMHELEVGLIERGLAEEQAKRLALICGGRPGVAIDLEEHADKLETRSKRADEFIDLLNRDVIERFDYVEKWYQGLRKSSNSLDEQRSACIDVLALWQGISREMLFERIEVTRPLIYPEQREKIHAISLSQSRETILSGLKAITETIDIISSNANIRLALESLVLNLPRTSEMQEPERALGSD